MISKLVSKSIYHPLKQFMNSSRAIGFTLLACTAISLLLSNIGNWNDAYRNIWETTFSGTSEHHLHIGFLLLPNSPLLVINDLLMAVFFFLAGMEIKRELVTGELSTIQSSLLPLLAAVGGMLAPALLYGLFNKGTENMHGWAIPTATDIAFTLGIASLLGKRVPVGLKIFLTALAIIDDLGAIVVIAIFYGGELKMLYLMGVIVVSAILWLLNKKKIYYTGLQLVLGLVLWYCMFNSGIHATVAGVLFAFLTPVNKLESLEAKLHSPVYFIIMPVFALANTAITIPPNSLQALNGPLSWGIMLALFIGKPLGICAACYFLVKKKLAVLPSGTNWNQLIGGGMLAGIGFTMSIFISTLAFNDPAQQDIAKISVLLASALAMIGGYVWLRYKN